MNELRLQQLVGSGASDLRPSSGDDAIVVEALAKRYPNGTDAVRGVSFRVAPATSSKRLDAAHRFASVDGLEDSVQAIRCIH